MLMNESGNDKNTVPPIKIAIAGAGLSGLCVAQGLLRAGFDVEVYESDPSPHARPQGYRITVDEYGTAALRKCLPPHLFELFLRTSGKPGGYFRFLNKHLDEIFSMKSEIKSASGLESDRQIDRGTLRALLLSGIEERVHFNKTVDRAEEAKDSVSVHFTDKTLIKADLLIGADGLHSIVRQQLLPECAPEELGFGAIYGKTLLAQQGRSLLPEELTNTGFTVLGESGKAFFFTTMHFSEAPSEAFARLSPSQNPPNNEDYLMWALVIPKQLLPAKIWSHDAAFAHQQARVFAGEYPPFLQKMVQDAEKDFTVATGLNAAPRPMHWRSSRITLMGDAVHVMPPFGAHGGNTALRDAALLVEKLQSIASKPSRIQDAVGSYQTEMLQYAFHEVKAAKSLMNRSMHPSPLAQWVMQTILPAINSFFKGRFSKRFIF